MLYHVVNQSIANFKIFKNEKEFTRILWAICYYLKGGSGQIKFSDFLRNYRNKSAFIFDIIMSLRANDKLVDLIAYCIMPTHLHLLLKELKKGGIARFMNNVLVSYTRYFNIRHKRKGHLWQGRSKKVLIETDEQLLHVTRYIHTNPVTAGIVEKPEQWPWSSYNEYLLTTPENRRICKYDDLLDIEPNEYRKYTEDNIDYQKELSNIKHLLLE